MIAAARLVLSESMWAQKSTSFLPPREVWYGFSILAVRLFRPTLIGKLKGVRAETTQHGIGLIMQAACEKPGYFSVGIYSTIYSPVIPIIGTG